MIHFKLILKYGMRWGSRFFFCVWLPKCSSTICWKWYSFFINWVGIFVKINWKVLPLDSDFAPLVYLYTNTTVVSCFNYCGFIMSCTYLLIFDCTGSLLLGTGFLWLWRAALFVAVHWLPIAWLLLGMGSRGTAFSSCSTWAQERGSLA